MGKSWGEIFSNVKNFNDSKLMYPSTEFEIKKGNLILI